jgi:hypothetical protein
MVFWAMTPYSLVSGYRRLEETCTLKMEVITSTHLNDVITQETTIDV